GPGGQPLGAAYIELGVKVQKQGLVPVQGQGPVGHGLQTLVRQSQPRDIAGQLPGVDADGLHLPRQLEDGRDGVVVGRVGRHRRGQGVLLGKAQAAVQVQRQAEQGHVVVGLVLFQHGELPLQRKAALGQLGHALVGQGELLFQLGDPLVGGRFGCRGHDSSPHILSLPRRGARESVLESEIENRLLCKILEAAEEQKFLRRGGPCRRRGWMCFQWRATYRCTRFCRRASRSFRERGEETRLRSSSRRHPAAMNEHRSRYWASSPTMGFAANWAANRYQGTAISSTVWRQKMWRDRRPTPSRKWVRAFSQRLPSRTKRVMIHRPMTPLTKMPTGPRVHSPMDMLSVAPDRMDPTAATAMQT